MISFPNAKINIGLRIVGKRNDGYHDIETIFYPVPLNDIFEVIKSEDGEFEFHQSGREISGSIEENLCVKAYYLLKKEYQLSAVKMHLHKIIPAGAGLGGGSSDAAHGLRLLNKVLELGLSSDKLKDYAAKLGADCPFFIDNDPAYATGKGDRLQKIDLSLKDYYIFIVHPGIHVSTAEAYAGVLPKKENYVLSDLVKFSPEQWKDKIYNRFEDTVFKKYPLLGEIKERIYGKGAIYASMSGSGSAVYGIFKEKPDTCEFNEYYRWCGKLI